MQFSKETKNSFFDHESPKFTFEVIKYGVKAHKDLSSLPMIVSPLTCKETGTNNLKQGIFGLHNNFLAYYGNKASNCPKAVLNITHSRLKYTNSSPREGYSNNSLVLMRNNNSFQLCFSDKETLENWKSALRTVCVLSTFHEDYVAKKPIGRGSFAKVYLIESKIDGTCYAAKTFTKDIIDMPNTKRFKSMLLNEIEIMRTLNHENIIKLSEVHETEKSIYLIMELVHGKALEDVLQRQHDILEERVKEILRAILDAAAYLASKDIMHRDLKPSNILIEKDGKVKIVDFGLATHIGLENYIFKKCGTPGFIAPEIFSLKTTSPYTAYNDRCDVFSIGCILFHLLFGYPLFQGSNLDNVLQLNKDFTSVKINNIIKKELDDPYSRINKEGLNLLIKLLESDHKKRISAKDALNHAYFVVPTNIRIKLPTSHDFPETMNKISNTDIFLSPTSVRYSRESQRSKSTRGDLSPNLFARDRYVEKESFCFDVGRPELDGRLNTLSNGSTNNSIILKPNSNPTSPRSSSNFATNKRLIMQKAKGQSQSFKISTTSPDNKSRSVLKAAIFRNIKLHRDTETFNDDESVGERTPIGLSPDRRYSDELVRNRSDSNQSSEIPSPTNESGEVGLDGEENCQIQVTIDKFMRGVTRKHSSKILKFPTFVKKYGSKTAR